MTDAPIESTDPVGAFEGGTDLDDLPIGVVRELFVTLGKALRAYQLYDENNPVYKRFVTSLREAFGTVWGELHKLHVSVEEDRFALLGEEVYRSESRADSLAFVFYKDGVRDISFEPGIEEEELERFLGVLQKAKNVRQEGDDLLTLLWEEDFQFFRYHYIDVLAEGVEMPEAHPMDERAGLGQVLEGEMGEDEEDQQEAEPGAESDDAPPQQQISRDDFNPTLYSLDARERALLEEELQKEMERDLRGDVLAALFDQLEQGERRERQSEIIGILRTLLPNFLSRGAVSSAADVLAAMGTVRGTPDIIDEQRAAEIDAVIDEVSAAETLSEFLRAVADGTIQAQSEVLGKFLGYLRSDALAELLRATEAMEDPSAQKVIREAVRGIATSNKAALLGLLDQDDPAVAAGAVRLVGELGLTESGPKLAALMRHRSPEVRLASIEAATLLKVETAAPGLESALADPDRGVRIAAARAIGVIGHKASAPALKAVVTGKEIRQADLTEKIAFFEAFGRVGETEALGVLDKFLNGKGFLGRREPSEIRACAAMALGMLGTPVARKALEKAKGVEDPVVRAAVSKALKGETE